MKRLSIALALSLFCSLAVAAPDVLGEVVRIADGDTLTVLTAEKRQVKVRLASIDTPERRQPWGSKARQALADKVFRQQVRVRVTDLDRYGRTVGYVYLGRRNINAELVAEGHAWVYRQYNDDPRLIELENDARRERRGMWRLSEFDNLPPWEWRRQQRKKP